MNGSTTGSTSGQGVHEAFRSINSPVKILKSSQYANAFPWRPGKNLDAPKSASAASSGSVPVPVKNDTWRDIQINIALDECEHIARRLRWLREQPSDPRVQAVIDAARDYCSVLMVTKKGIALESALAALNEPTKEEICECGFPKIMHNVAGSYCPQFKPATAQARIEGKPKKVKGDDGFADFWLPKKIKFVQRGFQPEVIEAHKILALAAWEAAKANGGGE